LQSRLLVVLHQGGVSGDVGEKDGGEAAGRRLVHSAKDFAKGMAFKELRNLLFQKQSLKRLCSKKYLGI